MRAREPGQIDFASGGQGSSAHMSMELFKYLTHTDLNHIPYKGATPALTDLIAGTVPVMFVNLPPAMGHIRAGKVRAVAVTTAQRWSALPDVPTVAEAGVPGFETVAWFGLLAPAATPRPIVERLAAEIQRIVQMPDVRARIEAAGAEAVGTTPEAFQQADRERRGEVEARRGRREDPDRLTRRPSAVVRPRRSSSRGRGPRASCDAGLRHTRRSSSSRGIRRPRPASSC
jgi:tripartite-type tricarboxylate transporter receptor subunit TctC